MEIIILILKLFIIITLISVFGVKALGAIILIIIGGFFTIGGLACMHKSDSQPVNNPIIGTISIVIGITFFALAHATL